MRRGGHGAALAQKRFKRSKAEANVEAAVEVEGEGAHEDPTFSFKKHKLRNS